MIDRDLYHQELATAVNALRDLDFKTLLEQEGIYTRLARSILLEQILNTISFEPDEQPSVISRLWDGIPSEPPIELSEDWINEAPPEYKELIKQRWSELRLQKHLDLTYLSFIDAYFLERLADLEQIVYGMIRMRNQGAAEELYLRLIDDEADFADLAKTYSLGDERFTHGLVGPMCISQPHPSIRQALSQLAVGDFAPPLRIEQWVLLLRMEHRRPAQLNEATRQQLLNELFEKDLQAALETLLSPEEETDQRMLVSSAAIDTPMEDSLEDDPSANQALPDTELTTEAESTTIAEQPSISFPSDLDITDPEPSIEEDQSIETEVTESEIGTNNQSTEAHYPDPVTRDSASQSPPSAATEQHGEQEPLESPVHPNLSPTSTDPVSSHHSLQSTERPESSSDVDAAQQVAHKEFTATTSVRLEGEHAPESIDDLADHRIDEAPVNAEIIPLEDSSPQPLSQDDQESAVATEQASDPKVLGSETLETSPEILVVRIGNIDQPTPLISSIPGIQPEIQITEPTIEDEESEVLTPNGSPINFPDSDSDGSETNLLGQPPNDLSEETSQTSPQPSTPTVFLEASSSVSPTSLSSESGNTEVCIINQSPAIQSNNSLDSEEDPKPPDLETSDLIAQPPSPSPVSNHRSNPEVNGITDTETTADRQITPQLTEVQAIVTPSTPSINTLSSEIHSRNEDLESSHSHDPQTDEQFGSIEPFNSDSSEAFQTCPQLDIQETPNLEINPVLIYSNPSNNIELSENNPEDSDPSSQRESISNSEHTQALSNTPMVMDNTSGETKQVPENSQNDIQFDDITGLPKTNLPTTKEHDSFATSNVLLSD
jgi:parvulin-like peptidyl-prolyl isomerase